jgi:thymidylate kinase
VFLLIEGIHDSGKSSLIDRLCRNDSYFVYEGKRLFPELADVKNLSITDFAMGTNCAIAWFAKHASASLNVVFDRLHLSEYAYSRSLRNANEGVAFNRFMMIDNTLSTSQIQVAIIYLHCGYYTMMQRAKEKNKTYSEQHYNELTDHFKHVLNSTKIPCCLINTENYDEDETYSKAVNFIKEVRS